MWRLRAAGAVALVLGIVSPPALADHGTVPARQALDTVAPSQAGYPVGRRDVIIVLDTSGSMADKDRKGVVKVGAAKTAILDQMQEIPMGTRVGLMTYPSTTGSTASGCKPTNLRLPVSSTGASEMGSVLGALPLPAGDTPTSDALLQAADYIKAESLHDVTVVLVSDGESNCGGNPCDTAKKLKSEHIDVTVNAVGFDISSQGQRELQCIAGASGGTYAAAEDSAALTTALRDQLGSGLSLRVTAPSSPVPMYEQLLDVGLTVSVEPGHAASNVQLHLEETGTLQGASVRRPLMSLGNLASGTTVPTSWQIRPPTNPLLDGTTFRATVSADGISPLRQDFTIRFSHDKPTGANLEGSLRDFKNVLVVGDSYSSGEGAGNNQRPYFTVGAQSEDCHRTKNQYANWLYSPEQVTILACSGAVAGNIYEFGQRGEQTQVHQLRDLLATGYRPDGVFMSISGNDIGFQDIATECAESALTEDAIHILAAAGNPLARALQSGVGPLSFCPASPNSGVAYIKTKELLGAVPHSISSALNEIAKAFKDFEAEVPPIIVVKYPRLLAVDPSLALQCDGSHPFQTVLLAASFASFRVLQNLLNKAIDEGVDDAQRDWQVPAYSADTVDAVPPGHNLCSADPWFVTLTAAAEIVHSPEMLHPNVQGHQAIAAAINVWARREGDRLKPAQSSVGPAPWWRQAALQWWPTASEVTVPLNQPSATSVGSLSYGMNVIHVVGGAPLTGVTIFVHSTPVVLGHIELDKEGKGSLDVDIQATDIPPSDHTLNAIGTAADGTPAVGTVAVHLAQPFPTAFWGLLTLAALLIVSGVLVLGRNQSVHATRTR